MAKYLLNSAHYISEQYLEEGTVIGEGSNYPLPEDFVPSAAMTPLDDDAKSVYEERHGEGARNQRAFNVNFRPDSYSGLELHPSFRAGVEESEDQPLKRRDRPEEDSGGRVSPTYASQLATQDVMDQRLNNEEIGKILEENAEEFEDAPAPKSPSVRKEEQEQKESGKQNQPNKTQAPRDMEGADLNKPGGAQAKGPAGTTAKK